MVLFISLIVLVALALGALAMFRGSMGTTLIATNVASRQGALSLADTGVQLAVANIQTRALAATVDFDDLTNGYFSSTPVGETTNWADSAVWTCGNNAACPTAAQLCGGDAACVTNSTGYTVLYKVHRMCTLANLAYNAGANSCALTEASSSSGKGMSLAVGGFKGAPPLTPYFRITTRVDGPRDTRTVTQTVVALQP
jgi:Tfp pilus assembly protein PilX